MKFDARIHRAVGSHPYPLLFATISGAVTARRSDRFRYDLDPPVEIPGFSGAPIVNVQGHVVGVMSVWFEPKMDGKMFLEAGGEDAATIYSEVRSPR